jgi:hypothetical protein
MYFHPITRFGKFTRFGRADRSCHFYDVDEPEIEVYNDPTKAMAIMGLRQWERVPTAVYPAVYLEESAAVVVHLRCLVSDVSIHDIVASSLTVKLIHRDRGVDAAEIMYVWSGDALLRHRGLAKERDYLGNEVGLTFLGRDLRAAGHDPTTLHVSYASATDIRDFLRVFPEGTSIVCELDECIQHMIVVKYALFIPTFVSPLLMHRTKVAFSSERDVRSTPGCCV